MTTDFEPSSPDPQTTVLVAALIRHVISFLSGLGLIHGVYSDSVIQTISGALVGIIMIGWSLWQKYQAARHDHEGSVKSAESGVPVRAVQHHD